MDYTALINTIKKLNTGRLFRVTDYEIADRYYKGDTDYMIQAPKKNTEGTPFRNADNRASWNFFRLLVQQKTAYAVADPPIFDTGDDTKNKEIRKGLGADYHRKISKLASSAAKYGTAWAHYWRDKDGRFQWAPVPPVQIIPVYSDDLIRSLIAVYRTYSLTDEEGNTFGVWELWTDEAVYAVREIWDGPGHLGYEPYPRFDGMTEMAHDYGRPPFIEFRNCEDGTSDLSAIKHLIDAHDKVYSGFLNDLEDIQEVILILSGYGGTNLSEFWQNLKQYKVLSLDDEEGDARTLSIEIPVEARKEALDATRKAIFEIGQGLDPRPESFGNQSGVALQFMYSLLELKVGLMEAEFRPALTELTQAILKDPDIIPTQTWTRTAVRNEPELVQMCRDSDGIVSKRTILANHPFVVDVEQELKQLAEEDADAAYDWGGDTE